MSKQSIFREKALKHYMRSKEEDKLLRFMSLPVAVFMWILLGLLLVIGLLAWYEKIPTYIAGSGIVLKGDSEGGDGAEALLFLPPDQMSVLRVGQPVQVNPGSARSLIQTKIERVVPGVTSPFKVCEQYQLGDQCARLVTQPAVVVVIKLDTLSATTYAGSALTASIAVGSKRIISFVPGLGSWIDL